MTENEETFIVDEDRAGECAKCGAIKFWKTSRTGKGYWRYLGLGVGKAYGCRHDWRRTD